VCPRSRATRLAAGPPHPCAARGPCLAGSGRRALLVTPAPAHDGARRPRRAILAAPCSRPSTSATPRRPSIVCGRRLVAHWGCTRRRHRTPDEWGGGVHRAPDGSGHSTQEIRGQSVASVAPHHHSRACATASRSATTRHRAGRCESRLPIVLDVGRAAGPSAADRMSNTLPPRGSFKKTPSSSTSAPPPRSMHHRRWWRALHRCRHHARLRTASDELVRRTAKLGDRAAPAHARHRPAHPKTASRRACCGNGRRGRRAGARIKAEWPSRNTPMSSDRRAREFSRAADQGIESVHADLTLVACPSPPPRSACSGKRRTHAQCVAALGLPAPPR